MKKSILHSQTVITKKLRKLKSALNKRGMEQTRKRCYAKIELLANVDLMKLSKLCTAKIVRTCCKLPILPVCYNKLQTCHVYQVTRSLLKISLLQLSFADLLQLEPTRREPVGKKVLTINLQQVKQTVASHANAS